MPTFDRTAENFHLLHLFSLTAMRTYPFLSLAAAMLLTVACNKDNTDPDGLVSATQEGKNTGDFLVNGVPFGPRSRVSTPADKPVKAYWSHSNQGQATIEITFFREDDNKKVRSLDVMVASIKQPRTYLLIDLINPYTVIGAKSSGRYTLPFTSPTFQPIYLTGPTARGEVIITRYDTTAHVISGTFEAKLREYQGPDSLYITKGRFDCTF